MELSINLRGLSFATVPWLRVSEHAKGESFSVPSLGGLKLLVYVALSSWWMKKYFLRPGTSSNLLRPTCTLIEEPLVWQSFFFEVRLSTNRRVMYSHALRNEKKALLQVRSENPCDQHLHNLDKSYTMRHRVCSLQWVTTHPTAMHLPWIALPLHYSVNPGHRKHQYLPSQRVSKPQRKKSRLQFRSVPVSMSRVDTVWCKYLADDGLSTRGYKGCEAEYGREILNMRPPT